MSQTHVLHVAEKNSVAKEIAHHLSNGTSRSVQTLSKFNPVYEFPSPSDRSVLMKVTSVRGHVFDYEFPQEYKSWNKSNPKLLLHEATIIKAPDPEMSDLVRNIESLARTSQRLVLWLDCDREGQAIAFEVIAICEKVRTNLVIRRARFSAVTRQDVLNAYNNLVHPNRDEAQAVQYRREIDFRLGCCFTRFQTLAFQENFPSEHTRGPVTYGPCQFPTLGFVVDRYLRVVNFVPEDFWVIKCWYVDDRGKKLEFRWKRGRIFDEECANVLFANIFQQFEQGRVQAMVVNQSRHPKRRFKPYPLATIALQKLGTQKLRMSSDQVMDHAEKLYQKGILSYPRTQTDSYPATMNLRNIVAMFENTDGVFGQYARKLLRQGQFAQPRKGKKNDNAHPPIHPVKSATAEDMTAEQWRVYDLICRHFLGSCSRDAEGEETVTDLQVAEEEFTTTHIKVIMPNYLQIFIFDKWIDSDTPPDLPRQFQPQLELYKSETTPPNYLTETELIVLMDKNQIGTDSTIHEHIKTILTRNFAVKTNQTIKPSKLGLALVQTYNEMEVEFAKCAIRRDIEQTMNAIAERRITREEAVEWTISKFIPIYDKLQQERGKWVQFMRRHLPNTTGSSINPRLGNMGLCGQCASPLTYNLANCSIDCGECRISLPVPYGEISVTDVICPICNYPCLQIENQAGKRAPRNICPKCYNHPDREWMIDLHSPNLQCSKCKFNCPNAKGLINQGLFQCPICKTNKASFRGTGKRFIGCGSWPACNWTRNPKAWLKDITPSSSICPICQEEERGESSICEIGVKEEEVMEECPEVTCRLLQTFDDPSRKKELMSFCLHPLCSPFLYQRQWQRFQTNNNDPQGSQQHHSSRSRDNNVTGKYFKRQTSNKKNDVVCFRCQEPGHFSKDCPGAEGRGNHKKGGQRAQSPMQKGDASTCYNCGQQGHYANVCKQPKQGFGGGNQHAPAQNRSLFCYCCKTTGHLTKNCPQIEQGSHSNPQFHRSNSATDSSNCYKCNRPGHFAKDCPENKSRPAPNNQPQKGKKSCHLCGVVGRHPKGSSCEAVKRKKGKDQHNSSFEESDY